MSELWTCNDHTPFQITSKAAPVLMPTHRSVHTITTVSRASGLNSFHRIDIDKTANVHLNTVNARQADLCIKRERKSDYT